MVGCYKAYTCALGRWVHEDNLILATTALGYATYHLGKTWKETL